MKKLILATSTSLILLFAWSSAMACNEGVNTITPVQGTSAGGAGQGGAEVQ